MDLEEHVDEDPEQQYAEEDPEQQYAEEEEVHSFLLFLPLRFVHLHLI